MSARVYLHPRLVKEPLAMQMLATTLTEWGYDMSRFAVYDVPSTRKPNRYELVRDLGHVEFTGAYDDPTPETGRVLQHMDGERFVHRPPAAPEPRRA